MAGCGCGCEGGVKLIYACSGAADVGEIADRVARKLAQDGYGKMTCLAGIGAGIEGFVESAKGAAENIAIDGCPLACARKSLERVGVKPTSYILTEMGLTKGSTPVADPVVETVKCRIQLFKAPSGDGGSCGCC